MTNTIRIVFLLVLVGIAAGPVALAMGIGTIERTHVGVPELLISFALLTACIAAYRNLLRGPSVSAGTSIALGVACGMALAIGFVLALRVHQVSDFNDYVHSARWLATRGVAGLSGITTWRPPGMTVALAVPMSIGFSDSEAVLTFNTLCAATIGCCLFVLFRSHRVSTRCTQRVVPRAQLAAFQ